MKRLLDVVWGLVCSLIIIVFAIVFGLCAAIAVIVMAALGPKIMDNVFGLSHD